MNYTQLEPIHDPGIDESSGMAIRVVINGDSKPVGQIAHDGYRWFVLNGFDNLLPFKFGLHITLDRSVKVIERTLKQITDQTDTANSELETPIEIASHYILKWRDIAREQCGIDIELAKIVDVDWMSSNSDRWTFVIEHDDNQYTLWTENGTPCID